MALVWAWDMLAAMRFWQSLFLSEAEQLFDLAKMAEEFGFDGVMLSDHVLYFEQMQLRYPYSGDGKPPFFTGQTVWPECWSTIAGLAAVMLPFSAISAGTVSALLVATHR